MVSNAYPIRKGSVDYAALLSETDRVAGYAGLDHKQTLYLRLLAEELVSMLPAIVRQFDGTFHVENEGREFRICTAISVENMDVNTRESLIRVSRENKNASVKGISGKILAVFDYMTLAGAESGMISPAGRYGFVTSVDYSCLWSLQEYRQTIAEPEGEKWDELERSIIAKLSDDVIVGVRGKKVNIIIKKYFEEGK